MHYRRDRCRDSVREDRVRTEIAAAHRSGRERQEGRAVRIVTLRKISSLKKKNVLFPAVIISESTPGRRWCRRSRSCGCADWCWERLCEVRAISVQIFVGQIFVARAVELIGAGLGGEVVKPATHLAELSREVAGLEREFFNRIDRLMRDSRGPVGVVLAGRILTFHLNAETGLAVHGRTVRACARHAGRQHVERERAADIAGSFRRRHRNSAANHDGFGRDDGALFRISVFELSGFRGHSHGLGRSADLQRYVDAVGNGN